MNPFLEMNSDGTTFRTDSLIDVLIVYAINTGTFLTLQKRFRHAHVAIQD